MSRSKKATGGLQKLWSKQRSDTLKKLLSNQRFSRIYLIASLVILAGTTLLWSFLSARVHLSNADQLINPYLFENSTTFREALIPGQHTFLFKWPIFLVIRLFGSTNTSYIVMTMLISLLTVAGLAYMIYRIERRPLVFSTLTLMLTSVLWLTPAQPYAGALLPVNLAMIATRNLEYLVYILALYFIIRARRIRSRNVLLGSALLCVLIASDKLFLSLTLGASLLTFIMYALRQKWQPVILMARWFAASIGALVGALVLLGLLSALKVTHIAGRGNGPYGFIDSVGQAAHAVLFAFTGFLSNFGANPAFGTASVRDIPHQSLGHIFSFMGPALIVNLLIALGGAVLGLYLLKTSFMNKTAKNKKLGQGPAYTLSLLLLWTTVVAFGAFLVTNHYYAVDARYLTIGFFAIFISFATYTRSRRWQPQFLVAIGGVILLTLCISVTSVLSGYQKERQATAIITNRNALIAEAIASHPVNVLVGDYWRVVPIKQTSRSTITIMPLSNCTTVRDSLSSRNWQPDLNKTSFAYVLSLDKGLTDYPACKAADILSTYGKPNASVVITGTTSNPEELLLFYDHGAHPGPVTANPEQQLNASVVPISLEDLTTAVCSGPTIVNIVAHQDDDLLFLNPDLQRDIAAGHCIRTIYITAGDAGSNQFYWLGREQGSEAAYSKMIGIDALWVQRTVKLAENEFVTVASPKTNKNISLIFMHLADGNIHGEGFAASRHESLQKLLRGQIPSIQAVYGESFYTTDSLIHALAELLHVYQPAEVRTLSTFVSTRYPDHSDHMTVSRLVERAHAQYEKEQYDNTVSIPLKHYIGYPIHQMDENISGDDLAKKTAAFLAYAKHDNGVCQSFELCSGSTAYGAYLRRQYQLP
jgi:LmbE family N-acetylglucosaminyl deacetylase